MANRKLISILVLILILLAGAVFADDLTAKAISDGTFVINNLPPILDPIANITVNETDLVSINPTATDPNGDTLTFYFTSPLNSSGDWLTTIGDKGVYFVNVTVSDGSLTDSQIVMITVLNITSCGDGNCDPGESCSSCSQDCGSCGGDDGGGGGGGGGGGAAPSSCEELRSQNYMPGDYAEGMWECLQEDEPVILDIKDEDIGVDSLELNFDQLVEDGWIKIEKVEYLPSTYADFPLEVYRNLLITKSENLKDSDIKNIKIRFIVSEKWLEEQGFTPDNIALYKYENGEWVKVSTTLKDIEDGIAYYETTVATTGYYIVGQSYFVKEIIIAKEAIRVRTVSPPNCLLFCVDLGIYHLCWYWWVLIFILLFILAVWLTHLLITGPCCPPVKWPLYITLVTLAILPVFFLLLTYSPVNFVHAIIVEAFVIIVLLLKLYMCSLIPRKRGKRTYLNKKIYPLTWKIKKRKRGKRTYLNKKIYPLTWKIKKRKRRHTKKKKPFIKTSKIKKWKIKPFIKMSYPLPIDAIEKEKLKKSTRFRRLLKKRPKN